MHKSIKCELYTMLLCNYVYVYGLGNSYKDYLYGGRTFLFTIIAIVCC